MKPRVMLIGKIMIYAVGVVLVLAGVLKLVNVGAEDMIEGLHKARLAEHQRLISITAIVCGILLLVPVTRRFGLLMASAYWGGAIVAHMTYNDSVIMPASFMALLCSGVIATEWAERT